jgi:hypothetical protein
MCFGIVVLLTEEDDVTVDDAGDQITEINVDTGRDVDGADPGNADRDGGRGSTAGAREREWKRQQLQWPSCQVARL